MPSFILKFVSWAPVFFGVLGAAVTVLTGLQALMLVLSVVWPGAKTFAAELGALALDLQRLAGWLQRAFGAVGRMAKSLRGPKGPSGGATVGLVFVFVIVGCAAIQKGTQDTCTVLDSGNPAIGMLCLTLEEVESLFGHVRATRALLAAHPDAQRKVDICEAPLPASSQ
jgi:hypothetical protein